MIGRRQQVALALTAVLAAAAAYQNHERHEPSHPAPSGAAARGFTLVASGGVGPEAGGHSTGCRWASAERL
ncbi:hypothetical protein ACFYZB_11700 [Streptomyces sp. NPDC001852]|uniref:hypothetical protein n=1 Tax=Streptomyces sp. NPDC001852 TaxID=3364619 RepID=UPI0036A189DC